MHNVIIVMWRELLSGARDTPAVIMNIYACQQFARHSFYLDGYFVRATTSVGTHRKQNVPYIIIIIVGGETQRRDKTVSNGPEQWRDTRVFGVRK